MKKSERLTQELLYLQGKTTFHLADLMDTFAISKRTAVRDVQSLEELGLPLVVETGRYGGYQILKNQLTPLYFDKNERYTLFFALQLLQKLTDSPFDRSYQGLRRKLLQSFYQGDTEWLEKMETAVSFQGVPQLTSTPILSALFSAIVQEQVIQFSYQRYQKTNKTVQPYQLDFRAGYWYCLAYDCQKQAFRRYRCDAMQGLAPTEKTGYTLQQLAEKQLQQQVLTQSLGYDIRFDLSAKERLWQEKYPDMAVVERSSELCLEGHIADNELGFLADFLLQFGPTIKEIHPLVLKQAYTEKVRQMLQPFATD